MEQVQSPPNKAQPKKKQQQEVPPPVESKAEPQVGTKEENKKVVKVDNMTITYN